MPVALRVERWLEDLGALGAVVEGPGLVRWALPTPTLPPATTTNHWLVGQRQCVLVDPATPQRQGRELLAAAIAQSREAGRPVVALLLTHHHRDHIGAAAWLAEACALPVWAHAETRERVAPAIAVDRTVSDGEAVAWQDDASPWLALHTPGHAPGHLALLHAASGQVVAGDLVAGEGTILIDPRDGHMGQYLDSLQRLAELGARRLAPAHGRVLDDAPAVLAHYRQHRLQREEKVATALDGTWREVHDLLPHAYGDVSRVAWPLAVRSMMAHLVHLEELGRARLRREGERMWATRV